MTDVDPHAGQMSEPEVDSRPCMDCGSPHRVWFAPNATWNAVMGDGDAGVLCPSCFIGRAEAIGMVPTAWVLSMERPSRRWTWKS